MFLSSFLQLFGAVLAVCASATPPVLSPRIRHDSRLEIPHGWSLHRSADPSTPVPLKFALTQSNLHNLDTYLLDIADPDSPNYGKHWTPAQVAETFRPSESSVSTVHSWLVNDGEIEPHRIRLSPDGGALHLNATVAEAEKLLAAQYFVYRHGDDGREHLGCHRGYHLPEHISKHVDLVWPTVHFGGPSAGRLSRRADMGQAGTGGIRRPKGAPKAIAEAAAMEPGSTYCDKAVTLDCLRGLYDFNYTLVSADKNTVAVVEFGSNVFLPSDLDLFFKKFDPPQVSHHPTLISIAGGHLNASESDSKNLLESTMDFQLLMGLLDSQQNVLLYQVGKNDSDWLLNTDGLLAALDGSYCSVKGVDAEHLADCGNKPRANVVSISYYTSAEVSNPDLTAVLERQCAEFGKLALTGITFVVSSGDTGVSYGSQKLCNANGTLVTGNKAGSFVPQFPASCPYVTAVGATQVAPGNSVNDREIATTAFPSGGGFSNIFSRPSFQDRVVNRYLKNAALPYAADIFNRTGRAYPDVAANGYPTVGVVDGNLVELGGTSASAPIFAALIAAVNDARLAKGKSPVGWINPAIYSHVFRSAFHDVTTGSNPGCATDGFPAARGWDPVTGLGTPNFPLLLSRFMGLP